MTLYRLLPIILCFSLLFFAPTNHADELDQLIQQLDDIRTAQNITAYAIVITTPSNVLIAENRGAFSSDSDKKISPDAYFRVGSITKSFIGLAALIAEQDGLVQLGDPVRKLIGAEYFENPWRESAPVTLEQLLQHSGGLADMSSREEFNHNTEINNRDGLALYARERKIRWSPGRFYSYSNTGFGLAGLTLESASQMGIDEFLHQRLFGPLEMPSATLKYSQQVRGHLVPGYDSDGRTELPYWHMIFPAFGALNVQPKDMAHFLQLYLNRGKYKDQTLISAANMARAEKPSTTLAAREGLAYGYGLGLYNWYQIGHEFFGHGGDGDGYLARFGYSHEASLGYFIVINRFQHQSLRDMQRQVEQWIVSDLPAVDFPAPIQLEQPDQLLGSYRSITSRFSRGKTPTLEIFAQANKLYSRLGDGRSRELIPITNNKFRRRNEPVATIVIKETDEGIIFVGDDGNFIKQINPK